MGKLATLNVRKMVVMAWKNRITNALCATDGSFVLGSFPSVRSAEEMVRCLESIRELNVDLIELHTESFRADCLDFDGIQSALVLTESNKKIEREIEEIAQLITMMNDFVIDIELNSD